MNPKRAKRTSAACTRIVRGAAAGLGAIAVIAPAGHPAAAALLSSSSSASYWGDPSWTLETLSISAQTRLASVQFLANETLRPGRLPASLLRPRRFDLTPAAAEPILAAYSALAAARAQTPTGHAIAAWDRRHSQNLIVTPKLAVDVLQNAIAQGAAMAGVPADFLTREARLESSLAPYAHATTTTAAGLYQFVNQTWLLTLKRYGRAIGLARAAAAIDLTTGGRAVVVDPRLRAELLDLRYNPAVASAMAGALTREDAVALDASLGRRPTDGELYAAHVFGPQGATLLIAAARYLPTYPASRLLPAAAAKNPSLFFRDGRPRSAGALVGLLASRQAAAHD